LAVERREHECRYLFAPFIIWSANVPNGVNQFPPIPIESMYQNLEGKDDVLFLWLFLETHP